MKKIMNKKALEVGREGSRLHSGELALEKAVDLS